MDKRELIGFILNDIKELELIVKGMYEMEKIPEVMQELAINKTQNIHNRFLRLRTKDESEPEIRQLTEKVPEESLQETIDEEQAIILHQEIEGEKTVEQDILPIQEFPEPEKEEPVQVKEKAIEVEQKTEQKIEPEIVEEIIQPEEIEPEEEKGTVFANVKAKVQERTTNEKFKSRIPATNVVATGKRVESRFIQNIRKAINLNDRYRYQKELFGGNAGLMNSVIDKLDAMNSLEEATAYIQKEFAWDTESATVTDFYLLLESRFS